MIQATHNEIEIEMELRQLTHAYWKCDYTLIKHPKGTTTIHHGDKGFRAWISLGKQLCRKLAMQSITPDRFSQRTIPSSGIKKEPVDANTHF